MIETYTHGVEISSIIAASTNPWVEVDGTPVNWKTQTVAVPANDCDQCEGSPVPGAIPAMDTDEGIQRCDLCERCPDDFEAASALARLVGGTVKFETEEH